MILLPKMPILSKSTWWVIKMLAYLIIGHHAAFSIWILLRWHQLILMNQTFCHQILPKHYPFTDVLIICNINTKRTCHHLTAILQKPWLTKWYTSWVMYYEMWGSHHAMQLHHRELNNLWCTINILKKENWACKGWSTWKLAYPNYQIHNCKNH